MNEELARQQKFNWTRTGYHPEYNKQLSKFKVVSCLDQVERFCTEENASERSLLDIACGDGFITSKLAENFGKVVGIDANAQVIDVTNMLGATATLRIGKTF